MKASGLSVSPQIENDRLDMQDHLFLLTLGGKRALCPKADTAKRVLDIGTGTGIWAMEYGEFSQREWQFPLCHFC